MALRGALRTFLTSFSANETNVHFASDCAKVFLAMDQATVLFDISSGVAEIVLNRPDKLNSFNRPMAAELLHVLRMAAEKNEVRAVLLRGEGRGFCAGQDLAEVAPRSDGSVPDLGDIVRTTYNQIVSAIRNLEKPVVCAVTGIAAGAGANLALVCDLVFASEDASFVQSFSKVGLIPDSGGTYFLPRLVGLQRAAALAMLGNKLNAQDAERMGLIYKVCAKDEVLREARETARFLATQPTRGLGLTKKAFNLSFGRSLAEQLDLEEELQRLAGQSPDYKEGVRAFLEKRPPQFTGE